MAITLLTDAYDSVANVDQYHSDRGATEWAAIATEAEKEQYIRKATDYIDRSLSFKGVRATASQRLKFPRDGIIDKDGYTVTAVDAPWQIKEATAIVADLFRDGSVDLSGVVSTDGVVTKRKIDTLEIEYDTTATAAAGAIAAPALTNIAQLLGCLLADRKLVRS